MRAALRFAPIYRLFQTLVGADVRARFVNEFVQPCPDSRVLDIGCGPADILSYMPEVRYVGVDISADYIRSARRRFGERAQFHCRGASETEFEAFGTFDVAIAFGLLHHMNDDEARKLLLRVARSLNPQGRLITFDGCFVQGQSWAARRFLRWDRGRFVRSQPEYVELPCEAFGKISVEIRHDLLRIPYTHIIMQCTNPRFKEAAKT